MEKYLKRFFGLPKCIVAWSSLWCFSQDVSDPPLTLASSASHASIRSFKSLHALMRKLEKYKSGKKERWRTRMILSTKGVFSVQNSCLTQEMQNLLRYNSVSEICKYMTNTVRADSHIPDSNTAVLLRVGGVVPRCTDNSGGQVETSACGGWVGRGGAVYQPGLSGLRPVWEFVSVSFHFHLSLTGVISGCEYGKLPS